MQNDYDFWMKWNDRLKQAFDAEKRKRSITATELAKASGTSSASVSDWFSGKTQNIEARFLIPACKFLRVSPLWVMLGEDDSQAIDLLPGSLQVSAAETVRLVSLYAQSTGDGKRVILNAAEVAEKLSGA